MTELHEKLCNGIIELSLLMRVGLSMHAQAGRLFRGLERAVWAQAGPAMMACEAAWLARSASLASSSGAGAASASGPACSQSSSGFAGASRPSHASGPASRTCFEVENTCHSHCMA